VSTITEGKALLEITGVVAQPGANNLEALIV
jgi:hypothetical protein